MSNRYINHNTMHRYYPAQGILFLLFILGIGMAYAFLAPWWLNHAIEKGNEKTATILLSAGVNPNLQMGLGDTALMCAACRGDAKMVALLLQYQADADLQNRYGQTALVIAVKNGHEGILARLLQHQADANLQDRWGETPLMHAVATRNIPCVAQLLSAGANPHLKNIYDQTARDLAEKLEDETARKTLLQLLDQSGN